MMCLDKRNGTSEPASRATQRCCGLFSWSCRPDLATARRAGWSHAQETGIVRRRAGPLPSALGRVQKTRGGPFGTLHKIGALCRRGWSHFGVTQSHDTASFCLGAAPATVLQPCATDQKPKRTSSAAADSKAAASNFAWPCAGRYDATDGVSAGHLRRFGAAAREKCATAIARREAGTARRPPTRRPLQKAAQQRAVSSRIQWCVAAAPLDVNAIAATQNSMIYDAGRRRLRRVRHVLLHDDGEAGLVRFVGQGAQREM